MKISGPQTRIVLIVLALLLFTASLGMFLFKLTEGNRGFEKYWLELPAKSGYAAGTITSTDNQSFIINEGQESHVILLNAETVFLKSTELTSLDALEQGSFIEVVFDEDLKAQALLILPESILWLEHSLHKSSYAEIPYRFSRGQLESVSNDRIRVLPKGSRESIEFYLEAVPVLKYDLSEPPVEKAKVEVFGEKRGSRMLAAAVSIGE